jgi:HEAT repeat protein
MPSFEVIKTRAPWYKKPGSLAAIALFVVLGAVAGFLWKGDEAVLLKRVQAFDPVSPICAYALGWRGIQKEATRDAFEQILGTWASDKPAPEEVRRACAYALGMTRQKQTVDCLIDALRNDPSIPVRCAAVRAIGKVGEPVGAEWVTAAISDNEAEIRVAAAEGALYMGDKRAIDKLIDRIDDPVPEVRRACHASLVEMTGTSFDGTDEKLQWRRWREHN